MKNIFCLLISIVTINFSISAQTQVDTIDVSTGWNLIGSLSSGATVEIINTDPPGIIETSLWGFNPDSGYYPADTLNKGKGYWVKVIQGGKIILGLSIPFACGTSQLFYEGRYYNTIQIGSQCWLKENLDVGVMIQGNQNQTNNGIVEKYCYGNDPANCNAFGGLYQWNEAMQYSTTPGAQGICPTGWHIPTLAEFQTLAASVGNDGNALKATGQGTTAGVGSNLSGFSAFLAGERYFDGSIFGHLNYGAYIWNSNEYNQNNGVYLHLTTADILFGNYLIEWGFSIRCLKD